MHDGDSSIQRSSFRSGNHENSRRLASSLWRRKADLEIRPLTVLAGANSSGKSSLMQPLLLMKQTFDSERSSPDSVLALRVSCCDLRLRINFCIMPRRGSESLKRLTIEIAAENNWAPAIV